MKYLLTLIYLVFTTSGIFLMKLGGDSMYLSLKQGIEFKMHYITGLGFVCYAISFLLWQKIVVTYDLSYIFPIVTGISQIIIVAGGILLFKEKINVISLLGIATVIVGIILITLGKNNM